MSEQTLPKPGKRIEYDETYLQAPPQRLRTDEGGGQVANPLQGNVDHWNRQWSTHCVLCTS